MVDWTSSMQQTFEYYIVDPATWKDSKRIRNVKSCCIDRDSEAETLGGGTFDVEDTLGECYIRVYLVTVQNGVTEKHPLGTLLVQTPSNKIDGKTQIISMDAYTPLLELKENPPPLGYSIMKDTNIMDTAYSLTESNVRAPVVRPNCDTTLYYDFVAELQDTWLSYVTDLMSNAKYSFDLDAMGRILFAPQQDTASLQPVWTYNDDNSSILYPDLDLDRDIYGIPNVVEVIYSYGNGYYYSRVVNDDPNSPVSTVNRGREITHRITDPDLIGDPTENQIEEYAEQVLREVSSLEYTVSYTHGYCPVRVGDCVRLNYSRAKLTNVKAKVISQSIECRPGCPVTETAVFTMNLLEGDQGGSVGNNTIQLSKFTFFIDVSGHLILNYSGVGAHGFSLSDSGHLLYDYTGTAPDLSINEAGHLIYKWKG